MFTQLVLYISDFQSTLIVLTSIPQTAQYMHTSILDVMKYDS